MIMLSPVGFADPKCQHASCSRLQRKHIQMHLCMPSVLWSLVTTTQTGHTHKSDYFESSLVISKDASGRKKTLPNPSQVSGFVSEGPFDQHTFCVLAHQRMFVPKEPLQPFVVTKVGHGWSIGLLQCCSTSTFVSKIRSQNAASRWAPEKPRTNRFSAKPWLLEGTWQEGSFKPYYTHKWRTFLLKFLCAGKSWSNFKYIHLVPIRKYILAR